MNLEQLKKDKQDLLRQREEAVAQTHMINGALQFVGQKIEELTNAPKETKESKK